MLIGSPFGIKVLLPCRKNLLNSRMFEDICKLCTIVSLDACELSNSVFSRNFHKEMPDYSSGFFLRVKLRTVQTVRGSPKCSEYPLILRPGLQSRNAGTTYLGIFFQKACSKSVWTKKFLRHYLLRKRVLLLNFQIFDSFLQHVWQISKKWDTSISQKTWLDWISCLESHDFQIQRSCHGYFAPYGRFRLVRLTLLRKNIRKISVLAVSSKNHFMQKRHRDIVWCCPKICQ